MQKKLENFCCGVRILFTGLKNDKAFGAQTTLYNLPAFHWLDFFLALFRFILRIITKTHQHIEQLHVPNKPILCL